MKKKLPYLIFTALFFVAFFAFLFFSKTEHIVNELKNIPVFRKTSVSVLNFGDVMFDRGVRNIIENKKRDPFEYIKMDLDKIQDYDVVIANLEGPIVVMDRKLCQQKAYNFQFATDTTDRLKSIGINMVNIANNHSYDCYQKGVDSTKKYLNEAGIPYMGDTDVEKSYVVKEINRKKIAFVGIDRTVSATPILKYYELIKKLKTENNFVIVDIHWGTEYLLTENESQVVVGHGLVDSGADVVFGHHPHVIEPVRIYKGKVIFFSLGNFVFDQIGVNENKGIGAGVKFDEGVMEFNIYPYTIKKFAPDFLKGDEEMDFCNSFLKEIKHAGCSFKL